MGLGRELEGDPGHTAAGDCREGDEEEDEREDSLHSGGGEGSFICVVVGVASDVRLIETW